MYRIVLFGVYKYTGPGAGVIGEDGQCLGNAAQGQIFFPVCLVSLGSTTMSSDRLVNSQRHLG